jgi:hypothetical protein
MTNNFLRQIAAVLAILVALAPSAPLEAAKQNRSEPSVSGKLYTFRELYPAFSEEGGDKILTGRDESLFLPNKSSAPAESR